MIGIFKKVLSWISSIPKDKLLHFIAGMIVFFIFLSFSKLVGASPSFGIVLSGILTTALAIFKESWFDKNNDGEVSCLDVISTVFGGLTAALFSLLLI